MECTNTSSTNKPPKPRQPSNARASVSSEPRVCNLRSQQCVLNRKRLGWTEERPQDRLLSLPSLGYWVVERKHRATTGCATQLQHKGFRQSDPLSATLHILWAVQVVAHLLPAAAAHGATLLSAIFPLCLDLVRSAPVFSNLSTLFILDPTPLFVLLHLLGANRTNIGKRGTLHKGTPPPKRNPSLKVHPSVQHRALLRDTGRSTSFSGDKSRRNLVTLRPVCIQRDDFSRRRFELEQNTYPHLSRTFAVRNSTSTGRPLVLLPSLKGPPVAVHFNKTRQSTFLRSLLES